MEEKGIIETFLTADVQIIVFVILELILFALVLYFSSKRV